MKTEDLIRAYIKDHPSAIYDRKRDEKQQAAKPVIPVTRKGV